VLEQVRAVGYQRAHHPPRRQRIDDLVWQQLVVEVDGRQRDQGRDERQLEDQVVVEAANEHDRGERERREQLDGGIARRDRGAAVPAAST
jgi:hypothetical protein